MNRTDLLRVALEVAADQREVLVDPDEHTTAVELAVVATAHDDEGLLVLSAHGVQQFRPIIATTLPVGPNERHGSGVLVVIGEFDVGRQHGAHVGGIGAVFDGEQVAGVVPRRRWQNRRHTGRRSREGEARKGHWYFLVQPSPGRMYSQYENSIGTGQVHVWFDRPGAMQSTPPSACTII